MVDIGDVGSGGKQIVLCRLGGEIYAVDTLCPHEGGRISPGPLIEGRYVMCPLHNYMFDPKSGKVARGSCAPAKTYRAEEKDGATQVWV